MNVSNTAKILIIEDEMLTARSIEKSLNSFGHQVVGIATSYEDGFEMTVETDPDLVLMDIKLKGLEDGITLAQRIKAHSDVPVVFLTAHSDSTTVARALQTSPYGYLVKPYDDKELYDAIRMALSRYQTLKGN